MYEHLDTSEYPTTFSGEMILVNGNCACLASVVASDVLPLPAAPAQRESKRRNDDVMSRVMKRGSAANTIPWSSTVTRGVRRLVRAWLASSCGGGSYSSRLHQTVLYLALGEQTRRGIAPVHNAVDARLVELNVR